ncbi:Retinol dehydrogenase 12 [Cyphellophora attinorum]|uniref:Retinol dehydrogenase 12 n=1 Tax=Cyphellophora attinorum TaxID=1664694 RepID=A0A0N1P215_9EURO|nr:Retinol dehydrogenase 12 [Phialophora attinorum]KPI43125.1 Retinol dehydrogenase 12 [Phialophora attinorum]
MGTTPPLLKYFRSQLLTQLPQPKKSFAGQTVIITGSSSGLGFEAAQHIVRLGVSKLIVAVRNLDKGRAAAESIAAATGRRDVIEVWALDQADYASVKTFANRCQKLERLDVVVANAGTHCHGPFSLAESNERTITVNVISTLLLSLLLLPKLRSTAVQHKCNTVLTFVGSFVHWMTEFHESKANSILEELRNEKAARMHERYEVSKLMLLLCFRQLATELTQPVAGRLTTSIVNPGSVKTPMARANPDLLIRLLYHPVFRSTEVGSRTLAHAAEGHLDTQGQYLCDCKPSPELVRGREVQEKVWTELTAEWEKIAPGVMKNI